VRSQGVADCLTSPFPFFLHWCLGTRGSRARRRPRLFLTHLTDHPPQKQHDVSQSDKLDYPISRPRIPIKALADDGV